MVRAFLRQATEMVENPGRIGDWGHVDEAILQGVGRLSMAITTAFRAACDSLDGLDDRHRRQTDRGRVCASRSIVTQSVSTG